MTKKEAEELVAQAVEKALNKSEDQPEQQATDQNAAPAAAPEEVTKAAENTEEITPELLGYGGKTLEEMNKSELETFATYRDVNIKGCKSKADIIDRLREALDPSELEGDIWYGSPTIQELQKE